MLIDACGLKGKMSGGAVISGKHANFILNAGRARAADVLRLMRLAQGKVKKRFGVDLEPEIRLWK
jgi:UDP-N-acetylmuramate dehydrogenase